MTNIKTRDRPTNILTRLFGEERAQAALAALSAAGWVCVPLTPTPTMLEAGWAAVHAENAEETWREMVEAGRG